MEKPVIRLLSTGLCQVCGKSITNKRPDTIFCSNKCRMRRNRKRRKKALIAELIALSSRIPNDSKQILGWVTHIKDDAVLTGKHQFLDVNSLENYPISKIEKIIEVKKLQIMGYTVGILFKKWIK